MNTSTTATNTTKNNRIYNINNHKNIQHQHQHQHQRKYRCMCTIKYNWNRIDDGKFIISQKQITKVRASVLQQACSCDNVVNMWACSSWLPPWLSRQAFVCATEAYPIDSRNRLAPAYLPSDTQPHQFTVPWPWTTLIVVTLNSRSCKTLITTEQWIMLFYSASALELV